MNEEQIFAYLPKFAASRLIAWWSRLPEDRQWGSGNAFGIGLAKGRILGWSPTKPKVRAEAEAATARLFAEMLGRETAAEEWKA